MSIHLRKAFSLYTMPEHFRYVGHNYLGDLPRNRWKENEPAAMVDKEKRTIRVPNNARFVITIRKPDGSLCKSVKKNFDGELFPLNTLEYDSSTALLEVLDGEPFYIHIQDDSGQHTWYTSIHFLEKASVFVEGKIPPQDIQNILAA